MGRAFHLSFYLEYRCDIWNHSSYFVTMKTRPYFKESIRALGHWWNPGARDVFFIMTKTKALEDT